jgi:hypothetical protein
VLIRFRALFAIALVLPVSLKQRRLEKATSAEDSTSPNGVLR